MIKAAFDHQEAHPSLDQDEPLASICEKLLDNAKIGDELAGNAHRQFVEKFDISTNAAQITRLIGSVIGGHQHGG